MRKALLCKGKLQGFQTEKHPKLYLLEQQVTTT